MNLWVKKSVELAKSHGYLDHLADIYPVNFSFGNRLVKEEKNEIERAFKTKNKEKLISALLKLERFPIDDPYVGFFRHDKTSLSRNPKTVERIGGRLFDMGLNKIIVGANRVKSPSRQFGKCFRDWLVEKLGYPVLPPQKFLAEKGTAVLFGGDAALKKFARNNLGYKGEKGLDLVLRVKDKFIIGEAKFISTSGGTQDKSFRETMSFIKKRNRQVFRIAVLDGVVWVAALKKKNAKTSLYQNVLKLSQNQIALSALLLKDFIESIKS